MRNTIYIFAFLLMGSVSMPNAWAQYSTSGTSQDSVIAVKNDTITVVSKDTIAVANKDTAATTGITLDTKVVQFEDLFSATKVTAILFVLIFTFLFNSFLVFFLSRLAENKRPSSYLLRG